MRFANGQIVETQPAIAVGGRAQAFFFDALNFGKYDEFGITSRIDLFVQVPFDIITFVKKDDGYKGGYTLTTVITTEDGTRLIDASWDRSIQRNTFEGTNNPGYYDLSQKSFSLEPGTVMVEILYEDKESAKEFRISRRVVVKKYDAHQFGMSDVMLVSKMDMREGRNHITPLIDPNVAGLKDGFSLFFEVYNPFTFPTVDITYTITKRGGVVSHRSESQPIKVGSNTFITTVASGDLTVGTYDIQTRISRHADSTEEGKLAVSERPFVVEWLSGGIPVSINDLADAIEQLRYFAKSEDLDYIKRGETEDERRTRFEAFWEKNNPTHGSVPNRAMVSYYTRVAYANEHFRHYIDGWKTDRGMVYIIYGPPSAVDRHPVDVESKPYEVWDYYDINKRFVFTDETGFGDYRLLYPIWDDRNRMR